MQEILRQKRHRLEMYAARLEGVSPLKKLQGPYAFLTDSDGKPLQQASRLHPGDQFSAYTLDATIEAKVCQIKKKE